MNTKMEKIDYTVDPSDHDTKNVLLAICDSSQESPEIMTNDAEELHYEVRNADGILYRFTSVVNNHHNTNSNTTPSASSTTAIAAITTNGNNNSEDDSLIIGGGENTGNSAATAVGTTIVCSNSDGGRPSLTTTNCQFFVINDLTPATTTTRHCLISPKLSTDVTNDKPILIGTSKKRDERRRATHNEVERRRRDKINQWIFKLRDLLPDNQETELKATKTATSEYSKGGILIRACEYIRNIKDQNQTLQECLKENKDLNSENAVLRNEIIKLQKENERLKILLANSDRNHHGVKMEQSDLVDFETS